MQCPYCHYPLEPLIFQGRHTGAWQCVKCTGAWLQYPQLTGLLEGGQSTALVPSWEDRRPSPWQSEPSGPSGPSSFAGSPGASSAGVLGLHRPPTTSPTASPKAVKRSWWRRDKDETGPEPPKDWDICTYCGRPQPGPGITCRHCNVERMRCPSCGAFMIGVRKHGVLVDLCITCRGLFFEKGRMDTFMARLWDGEPAPGQERRPRPESLLQQLAAFLEDTEPDPYTWRQDDSGILKTVSLAFGSGFKGGKQILYDMLVLLGDLQTPPDKPPSRSGR